MYGINDTYCDIIKHSMGIALVLNIQYCTRCHDVATQILSIHAAA